MFQTRFLPILRLLAILLAGNLALATCSAAVDDPEVGSLNKPERLEWFRDQGFGLFIHWSVDSQLGVVISHSLVGASPEYTDRFFQELPKTFDPHDFHPLDWARLAHLAGVRYVMFTPSTIPASPCSTRRRPPSAS
jgi:alpha-L-fucosidase